MRRSFRFPFGLPAGALATLAIALAIRSGLPDSTARGALGGAPALLDCALPAEPAVPDVAATAAPPAGEAAAAGEWPTPDVAAPSGRLLVLPGVANTRFHLGGFVARAEERLPGFEIEVRRWGVPLLRLHNLRAHDRNVATAAAIANEIAAWRREHPDAPLYVLGYSGGGGLAALVVASLPDGVTVDRLFLVAPAISPRFPVERSLLPHVDEFIVNYASEHDLQVGWGTRVFGTIDRVATESAGAIGFFEDHARLLEWHWTERALAVGHSGGHLSYLGRRWQNLDLMPALDPEWDADRIRAHWHAPCGELR